MNKNMVISFPRSGTHLTLKTINPDKRHGTEWRDVRHGSGSDVQLLTENIQKSYKSHHISTYFSNIDEILDKYKVIYAVRDVKDVMISYWFYLNDVSLSGRKNKDYYPYHEKIEDFVYDNPMKYGFYEEHFNVDSNSFIDMWNNHINSWLVYDDKIFILKYDDLLYKYDIIKPELEEYLGRKISDSLPTKDIMKTHAGFRKGITGDYKNYMSDELIDDINKKCYDTLKKLNYIV